MNARYSFLEIAPQAASRKVAGCGIEHSGNPARFRPEGRPGDRKTFEARIREWVTGHTGEKDVTGGITRTGDEMVRTAFYEAANVLLSPMTRFSRLKRWGMDVAKRRGSKRPKVALAWGRLASATRCIIYRGDSHLHPLLGARPLQHLTRLEY